MKEKHFYSPKEYAELTGLHINTVYEWIKKGAIETLPRKKYCKYLIPTYELPTLKRSKSQKKGGEK